MGEVTPPGLRGQGEDRVRGHSLMTIRRKNRVADENNDKE